MNERETNNEKIGELPFYDFILLGHSVVGKTTYLTMLCWLGGNKNNMWNFKVGGSGLDVPFIPKDIAKNKEVKKKFAKLVDDVGSATGKEIDQISEKIGEQDGSYSTQAPQEMVFSFRPTGDEKEHTLLTLDYPGEWLSIETQSEERIEQFVGCLSRSHALIIMIDPLFYLDKNDMKLDFYSQGLEDAQNRLRAKERPGKFARVEQIPVAVIINKADLLQKELLGMNPKDFLKNNCRNFFNSVNKLSKNWEAFFVSCYGLYSNVKKLDERGAYKPPPTNDIKPLNLNKPFEWIHRQRKRRILKKIARNTLYTFLFLCFLFVGLFTWDSLSFEAIKKQEILYPGEPGMVYELYTGFVETHFAGSLTGFKEKAREKRKQWVNEYLNLKLKNPQLLKIPDFKGVLTQIREWSLDIEDSAFLSQIDTRIERELNPPFEKCYADVLYAESDRSKYEKGFKEFRQFFPGSAQLPLLEEKHIYMEIYWLANDLNGTTEDFNKLVQYSHEYIKLSAGHSNKYRKSVEAMIKFINSLVDNPGSVIKPRRLAFVYQGFSINDSMLGTHEEEKPVTVRDGWDNRIEYRKFTIVHDPEVRIIIEANEKNVFESSTGKVKVYSVNEPFDLFWLPGQKIVIKAQNFTGKTVEITRGGFLALNVLLGEVNIDNETIVRFSGTKMTIPPLAKP
jgi:hypothetical protein